MKWLLPVTFLVAAVGISYGVIQILNHQPVEKSDQVVELSPPKEIPNASSDKAAQQQIDESDSVRATEQESATIAQDPVSRVNASEDAREILEQFLSANTFAERLPLLETKTPQAELERSCLAAPFPPAPPERIATESVETNALEQVTDFFHSVDFIGGDGQVQPQLVLVRIRGKSSPKVVVDPFLDSFGGRLAEYAKAPSAKGGNFQVVISALASCYDKSIPNYNKKLTLKLLPRDDEKPIAEAYFGHQSEITRMLEDGNYTLSYAKAKACTVMLRWNVEDNPEVPYLEALKIISPDWNP